jgi:hypothetical protein
MEVARLEDGGGHNQPIVSKEASPTGSHLPRRFLDGSHNECRLAAIGRHPENEVAGPRSPRPRFNRASTAPGELRLKRRPNSMQAEANNSTPVTKLTPKRRRPKPEGETPRQNSLLVGISPGLSAGEPLMLVRPALIRMLCLCSPGTNSAFFLVPIRRPSCHLALKIRAQNDENAVRPQGRHGMQKRVFAALALNTRPRFVACVCPLRVARDFWNVPSRTAVVAGFKRIFSATIFFGTDNQLKVQLRFSATDPLPSPNGQTLVPAVGDGDGPFHATREYTDMARGPCAEAGCAGRDAARCDSGAECEVTQAGTLNRFPGAGKRP